MYVTMAAGSATAPTMTVLGMRVTVVAVLGVAAVLVRSIGGPSARDIPVIIAIGVLDATANLLYAFATTLGLLATTSVLASLYPVVTVVLAGILLHERLRQVQYVGIVVAVLGVALISAG
jgi:drug/metabolite transporter (DMT)-like permease